jgi:DNA-binding NarL/FixJ family response regulator
MKEEDPEEIIHAIRDVLGGHIYVSEEVLANPVNGSVKKSHPKSATRPLDKLTDTELEILECIGCGKTKPDIARQLHLSVKTVASAYADIRRKLKLTDLEALIRYAVCWVETGAAES